MPFIFKLLLMIAALVASVFVPAWVFGGSVLLLLALLFKPNPARNLVDLIFPDTLPDIVLTFVVVCASGVSLAVHLFG